MMADKIFEAILDTHHAQRHIEALHHVVPQITYDSIRTRSTFFVVVGCDLADDEFTAVHKEGLGRLMEERHIIRWRCASRGR